MPTFVDMLGFLNQPGPLPDVSPGNIARLRKAHESGLRLVHVTGAPPWCKNVSDAIDHLNMFKSAYEDMNIITTVCDTADLEQVRADKPRRRDPATIGVIWGLQGTPVNPAHDTVGKQVCLLYNAGIRIMGLAYDDKTPFGCGWREETKVRDNGLTEHGRNLISAMANTGMILDLAHAGSRTALQAVDWAAHVSCPVMISHTGAYRHRNLMRNATDRVMHAVMQANGIVGCYLLTFGLARRGSDLEIARPHLLHMLEICGEYNLVLGTDGVVGGYPDVNAWRELFGRMKGKLDPDDTFRARFPDQPDSPPAMLTPQRLTAVADLLNNIFGDDRVEDTAAIMGENAARFLHDALL